MWRLLEQAAKSATANASEYVSTVQEKAQSIVATVQDEAVTLLHALGTARTGPVDEVRRGSIAAPPVCRDKDNAMVLTMCASSCLSMRICDCRFYTKKSTTTRRSWAASRSTRTPMRSPRYARNTYNVIVFHNNTHCHGWFSYRCSNTRRRCATCMSKWCPCS